MIVNASKHNKEGDICIRIHIVTHTNVHKRTQSCANIHVHQRGHRQTIKHIHTLTHILTFNQTHVH